MKGSWVTVAGLTLAGLAAAVLMTAQTPNTGPMLRFTATTGNVGGAPDSVRIDLLRWSTDAERDQLISAFTQPGAAAGGRGGGRGRGRGAAPDEDDPAFAGVNPPAAAGGRGGGRGGRGGGRGEAAAPPTPETSLAAALEKVPTVGYLWSSEVAGYSLHYAVRVPAADGGERIVLISDRRLGGSNDLWKPTGAGAPTNYEFSLIELHVNSKGEGEGKASLTGKVAADTAAKTLALENYGELPVILKNVRRK